MKFLHAADLHLDSPLRGLARYEEAPVNDLRGATRAAFNNLVELAIEEKVAFVLLAGDLYDGTWQDFSTAIFLATKLGELDRAGIRVFGVLGNHDAQSKLTKALEKPKNLTLFPANKPQTEFLDDLEVAIHGQSFSQQHVEENLAVGFPAAKPGMFNIGLLHTSLDGREGHAAYAPCKLDDLRARDYQYWALGHVHAREEVSTEPWIVFPGSLQGRHVRETGPKGCCLVSVEDGRVKSVEHRTLDVVRWANCDVDLGTVSSMQGVLDSASKALQEVLDSAEDRIVATRIRFVGSSPVHAELQGRTQWLRQKLMELFAEVHGEGLWIEKVVVATISKLDREAVLTGDGALGGLAKSIMEVKEVPSAVRGLDTVLTAFREKLPAEVFLAEDGLRIDDQEVIARLIQEAKELLLGKLLETGSES
ncbi:metallophosphoesterase family protein [Desulfobulbus oligotrophicus]|uniref:Metallophosphoesterase n=1 Tax=Desulfobulbus oligotrophicus TaxID=1909699 RepID=A0A7T5VB61_9BACT|nr:DNA repair exonuclease [Desulfobulbus oligotrophicus]QQG64639.1 metallophosphoesterase [Desulfobulbus oligotrophicus]